MDVSSLGSILLIKGKEKERKSRKRRRVFEKERMNVRTWERKGMWAKTGEETVGQIVINIHKQLVIVAHLSLGSLSYRSWKMDFRLVRT